MVYYYIELSTFLTLGFIYGNIDQIKRSQIIK